MLRAKGKAEQRKKLSRDVQSIQQNIQNKRGNNASIASQLHDVEERLIKMLENGEEDQGLIQQYRNLNSLANAQNEEFLQLHNQQRDLIIEMDKLQAEMLNDLLE